LRLHRADVEHLVEEHRALELVGRRGDRVPRLPAAYSRVDW
jgi:hypothetical protein